MTRREKAVVLIACLAAVMSHYAQHLNCLKRLELERAVLQKGQAHFPQQIRPPSHLDLEGGVRGSAVFSKR